MPKTTRMSKEESSKIKTRFDKSNERGKTWVVADLLAENKMTLNQVSRKVGMSVPKIKTMLHRYSAEVKYRNYTRKIGKLEPF